MAGRKRHDPVVKRADGNRTYDRVGGKDKGRHYVLCNPNDESTGLAHYEHELGYQVETVRKGGPTTAASRGATEGAKVTSGGLVLVSCPIEDFDTRVADGQDLCGELEAQITDGDGVVDSMRGQSVRLTARVERERVSYDEA